MRIVRRYQVLTHEVLATIHLDAIAETLLDSPNGDDPAVLDPAKFFWSFSGQSTRNHPRRREGYDEYILAADDSRRRSTRLVVLHVANAKAK
jgi:hypothetical protein